MSLVIVRCKRCRSPLGSLDEMPADWSGNLTVSRCRKCVVPPPRRLIGVLIQQNATGFGLAVEVPLADLRRHAEKAARLGHAESFAIPPFRKAE